MARVTGIGGVFFKSSGDSASLAAWHRELWEPKIWDDNNTGD
jgi:hypothetical protein